LVLGDDAKAFFTTAENLAQPQDSEPTSHRTDFGRSMGFLAAAEAEIFGVSTVGGPTGIDGPTG
jgi:hypothetical protein